jgi:hypothetical protein
MSPNLTNKTRSTILFLHRKGMVDPGEVVSRTLVREFSEEALSKDLAFDKANVKARNKFEAKLAIFFKNGIEVTNDLKYLPDWQTLWTALVSIAKDLSRLC